MLPKRCNTTEEQAQTRRDDYQGKQCTTWAGITLPSAPHHLLACALLPSMAQRFRVTSSTMVRTATPTPDAAPLTGRCTSYGTLHPLRDATPDQNGCIAYGSGAAPTLTSTNADQTATDADLNATTAGPTKRPQHQHARQTISQAALGLRPTG